MVGKCGHQRAQKSGPGTHAVHRSSRGPGAEGVEGLGYAPSNPYPCFTRKYAVKDAYYAHSHKERPPQDWHRLEDHLKSVAEKARTFADDFHAGDWGYLTRLWNNWETAL